MAINLHTKHAQKIAQMYIRESLTAGALSKEYDFSGVRTVKISTLQTVPMADYTRSGTNRYGVPAELQDVVQELTMSQDKAFSLTIDKGNNEDQNGIKAAGKALALQIAERAVPEMDKYCFTKLATKGGTVLAATKPTKSTITELIADGVQALDDGEVPEGGRTLFVSAEVHKFIRLAPEFIGVDKLGEKSLAKGVIGEYMGMRVVKAPSGRLPKGLSFLIVHKRAGVAPVKIDDTKIHTDPPGISGNLLEGRQYYDCFVLGAKANGIYAYWDAALAAQTTTPTIAAATGALSGSGASAVYYYTTDGSDPRYSSTVLTGQPAGLTSGTVVKAYAIDGTKLPSAVAAQTIS